jgi:hypothetical protein
MPSQREPIGCNPPPFRRSIQPGEKPGPTNGSCLGLQIPQGVPSQVASYQLVFYESDREIGKK